MLAWEAEYPDKTMAVHHLMVLCYHLQHPHLCSPQGLAGAQQLLAQCVEEGAAPQEVRRRQRARVDSGRRTWKITGTPAAYGAYAHPIQWPIIAADVTAGGVDDYIAHVQAWARSVLKALKASGNWA
jgi:hypothetical protein